MELRKAGPADLEDILAVLGAGAAWLASRHIDQWNHGYPDKDTILRDIARGGSYVLAAGGRIIGTAALLVGEEPTYRVIEDGAWALAGPYLTIHRIAVLPEYKGAGAAGRFVEKARQLGELQGLRALRADTHPDNLAMQRFLAKQGFAKAGTIYLASGALRWAYERPIKL